MDQYIIATGKKDTAEILDCAKIEHEYIPLNLGDYKFGPRPHYSVLDKSKIKATYGINIPWWEDSLEECMAKLDK